MNYPCAHPASCCKNSFSRMWPQCCSYGNSCCSTFKMSVNIPAKVKCYTSLFSLRNSVLVLTLETWWMWGRISALCILKVIAETENTCFHGPGFTPSPLPHFSSPVRILAFSILICKNILSVRSLNYLPDNFKWFRQSFLFCSL